MPRTAHNGNAEIKRVGKFGIVGLLNTGIDLVLYNVLTSGKVGLSLIQANLVSTTVAMIFSFFANQRYVFQATRRNLAQQALVFFSVTAVGLYVLQSIVIKFLTTTWTAPLALAVAIVHVLGLNGIFRDSFVVKNGAKVAAIVVSLTWNYIMYKKLVFKP